jgi:hypothetical protein
MNNHGIAKFCDIEVHMFEILHKNLFISLGHCITYYCITLDLL